MKRVIVSLILILVLCSFKSEKENYVIQKITLKRQGLVKAIDAYLEEYHDDLEIGGVLVVKNNPIKKCYYITRKMYVEEVRDFLPSFYSIYKSRVVLIYTGFESDITFDKQSSIDLFKASNKYFENTRGVIYEGIIWKVSISDDTYEKEIVEGIGLDY